MRLFWSLPQLRESAALRSYIIGITLRIAGSVRRTHRRHWWLRLTPTGDLPERRACSSDDPEAREALWHFHSILEKLGPRTRRAFELRHVAKLELTDVASALGISLATTKRLLARASSRVFAMVRRDALLVEYYGLA